MAVTVGAPYTYNDLLVLACPVLSQLGIHFLSSSRKRIPNSILVLPQEVSLCAPNLDSCFAQQQ